MLDTLYENIGSKIKSWAKWTFIVEAISAVVSGVVLMGNNNAVVGLIVLLAGPLVAWVSSWILYAFGELVEDVHAVRKKYYPIAEEQANREAEEKAKHEAKELAQKKAQTFSCPKCSNTVNYGDVSCGSCGQQFDWSKM